MPVFEGLYKGMSGAYGMPVFEDLCEGLSNDYGMLIFGELCRRIKPTTGIDNKAVTTKQMPECKLAGRLP